MKRTSLWAMSESIIGTRRQVVANWLVIDFLVGEVVL